MVALALLRLKTPPVSTPTIVIAESIHTLEGPVIGPATGSAIMVMNLVALSAPKALTTLYFIVSMPAVTPVTTPLAFTVACVLLLLHTPPVSTPVKVIDEPTHTVLSPVIGPATGKTSARIVTPPLIVTAPRLVIALPANETPVPRSIAEAVVPPIIFPLKIELLATVDAPVTTQ